MAKKQVTSRSTTSKKTPTKKASAKPQLSAIDAAAQVLADAKEPMNTRQLIEVMSEKKLWTSPNGKTPDRTLYSAILRELNANGEGARFKKADRGKFVRNK